MSGLRVILDIVCALFNKYRSHTLYKWTRNEELVEQVSFQLRQTRDMKLFENKAFALVHSHDKDGLLKLSYSSPTKLLRLQTHDIPLIFLFNGSDGGEICAENLSLSRLFFDMFKFFVPYLQNVDSKTFVNYFFTCYPKCMNNYAKVSVGVFFLFFFFFFVLFFVFFFFFFF